MWRTTSTCDWLASLSSGMKAVGGSCRNNASVLCEHVDECKYVLFSTVEQSNGLHIETTDRRRPVSRVCLACATRLSIDTNTNYIGALSQGEAKKYVKSCDKASAYHRLYTNGAVVFDSSHSSLDLTHFTNESMVKKSTKQLVPLNNTNRYDEGAIYKKETQ